jgi:hypothetical protein
MQDFVPITPKLLWVLNLSPCQSQALEKNTGRGLENNLHPLIFHSQELTGAVLNTLGTLDSSYKNCAPPFFFFY